MKVSVLMSVFNDEMYVGKSIESILNQTFKDYEFIIINDGSTDSTASILDFYAAIDNRIIIIHKTNTGLTKSLNYGLSISQGQYIARMDSDDISFPKRLEIEVNFLDHNDDVDLIGGSTQIIDDLGNVIGRRNIGANNPKKTLTYLNIYQHSDVMFRRSILQDVKGYREKFRNAQDYDLWLRISEKSKIAKLPDILGQWRLNAGGYTIARNIEQKTENKIIRKLYFQRLKKGYDDYEEYQPKETYIKAGKIDRDHYNYIIGCHMIHSLLLNEGRHKIKPYMLKTKSIHSIILYLLSFFPKGFVNYIYLFKEQISLVLS